MIESAPKEGADWFAWDAVITGAQFSVRNTPEMGHTRLQCVCTSQFLSHDIQCFDVSRDSRPSCLQVVS